MYIPTYICVNKLYYIKKKKNLKAIKNSIKKRFNFCLTKSNAHREQKNCFWKIQNPSLGP